MNLVWLNFIASVFIYIVYTALVLVDLIGGYSALDPATRIMIQKAMTSILLVLGLYFFFYRIKSPNTTLLAGLFGVLSTISAIMLLVLDDKFLYYEPNILTILFLLWVGLSHIFVYKSFNNVRHRIS